MDVAGVVEAIGTGVTAFAPGDRVIAGTGGRFGGHAEFVCLPADGTITRAPASLSLEEAIGVEVLLLAFILRTAWAWPRADAR